jgi:hypothetical protein
MLGEDCVSSCCSEKPLPGIAAGDIEVMLIDTDPARLDDASGAYREAKRHSASDQPAYPVPQYSTAPHPQEPPQPAAKH